MFEPTARRVFPRLTAGRSQVQNPARPPSHIPIFRSWRLTGLVEQMRETTRMTQIGNSKRLSTPPFKSGRIGTWDDRSKS
jgi:hypothetical protein